MSTTCPRHPNVETNLTCASCGTPICPSCMVTTPVGMKCPDCGSQASSPLFRPSAVQLALGGIVGAAAGAVAGWAVEFSIGFLTLFLAVAYGAFAGEMILRACGRKRGRKIELVAGLGMVVGAIGGRMIVAALWLDSARAVSPPFGIWRVLIDLAIPSPIPLIALVIATAAAVSRIKHLW